MPRIRTIFGLTGATAALLLIAIVTAGPLMSQVEQPLYQIERADGPIEIRVYPAMVVAEVTVQGDRQAAIRSGFQIIAGYIFGRNVGSQKVEMTAPVMQERLADGTAGTARMVEQGSGRSWTVRFVMPRKWSLPTLPKPLDKRVVLTTKPAARFAVIRFSGLGSDAAIQGKTRDLELFIANNKLTPIGPPILAFFNPPWTLPFLRRNEIMFALK